MKTGIMFVLAFGALGYFTASVLDMPDVFYSYSSEKCTKVINYKKDDNFSCSNLPRIYNKVWVQ